MAEIELGCVAVQVLFADVKVATEDAPLEDREEVLDRIGVSEHGAHILFGTMVYGAVAAEVTTDHGIDRSVVGHQIGDFVDVRDDDRLQGLCGHIPHMKATDAPVAFNQRQHRGLWRDDVLPIARLAANVGFVRFDNLVRAPEGAGVEKVQLGHCLANAMPEEPCGFQSALKGALKLAGRDTLFRRAKQVHRLEPYAHGYVARLNTVPILTVNGLRQA